LAVVRAYHPGTAPRRSVLWGEGAGT
jgi:hypothetical protein